jgi:hypothetical protein
MKRILAISVSYFGLLFALCAYESPQEYPSNYYYDWVENQQPYEYSYPLSAPQYVQPQFAQQYPPPLPSAPQTQPQYTQPQPVQQYNSAQSPLTSIPQAQQMYTYRDLERVGRSVTGYIDLPWGSSVERLLQLYPECEEITNEDDSEKNIQRFVQEDVGDGIEARQFAFFKEKLYEVYVLYGYVDENTTQLMQQKLESIYGKAFKAVERELREKTVYFNMVDRYMEYDWDLQVIYTTATVYDYHNYKLGTTMTCLYVNRELKSEAERPKLNLRPELKPQP